MSPRIAENLQPSTYAAALKALEVYVICRELVLGEPMEPTVSNTLSPGIFSVSGRSITYHVRAIVWSVSMAGLYTNAHSRITIREAAGVRFSVAGQTIVVPLAGLRVYVISCVCSRPISIGALAMTFPGSSDVASCIFQPSCLAETFALRGQSAYAIDIFVA